MLKPFLKVASNINFHNSSVAQWLFDGMKTIPKKFGSIQKLAHHLVSVSKFNFVCNLG